MALHNFRGKGPFYFAVLLCYCVVKYFKTHLLKTMVNIYHSFCMSGTQSDLTGWFWLGLPHEVIVRISHGSVVIWRLDWDYNIAGCWQKAEVPHHL